MSSSTEDYSVKIQLNSLQYWFNFCKVSVINPTQLSLSSVSAVKTLHLTPLNYTNGTLRKIVTKQQESGSWESVWMEESRSKDLTRQKKITEKPIWLYLSPLALLRPWSTQVHRDGHDGLCAQTTKAKHKVRSAYRSGCIALETH